MAIAAYEEAEEENEVTLSPPLLPPAEHELEQHDEPDFKRLRLSPTPPNPEIATRNRRLIYLQNHDEYFTKTEHAFSLPTLYNQLVSRFMSGRDMREHAADPASQTKFSEILARDLERGEDRMENLRRHQKMEEEEDEDEMEEVEDEEGNIVMKSKREALDTDLDGEAAEDGPIDAENLDADILIRADSNGEFMNVEDREEAWEIWKDILSRRFLRGDDEDFEYDSVDRPGGAGDPNHLIEVEIERDGWEEYFDGEEADVYTERDGRMYLGGKVVEGETGIQDF
ncbi:hypothetical protein TWF569_011124 [Orbilia oligospora]|uniref:CCD97-like C-terminal domain-containing protein n=1 Tax=Orbilia oligospora TaxID=2813651 RepID=A0A7C8PBG0_ORBOL|nr:hypothetical protein TWF102_000958 [Orbilia oligospora]KAF3108454.1 hypothetical protein TWF103_005536 [Orbilia oligospora]KAF3131678.1 hypothetical protein TWF569_011124 [Orbilia oligospora]KAF3142948.1 hypothetical protein TWF594_005338 [Orbilia oligospora]KAF3161311.1 hypothetical protein TWF751_011430 [Orbilia oligospora]